MRNRWMNRVLTIAATFIFSLAFIARVHAQQESAPVPATSATPDLSGLWSRLRDGAVARGYENYVLDFGATDSPMTPWAAAKYKITGAKYHGDNPSTVLSDPIFQCFPPGVPRIYLFNFPVQIVQIPGQVLMLFEFDHFVRRIYTDGRPHPADPDPSFHGHSIGHWEQGTLVVDTVGLLPQAYLAVSEAVGVPNNGDMHIVEHLHLLGPDTLADDLQITANKVLSKPWLTTRKYYRQRARKFDIAEGVCEQGSFSDALDKNGNSIFAPIKFHNGVPVGSDTK